MPGTPFASFCFSTYKRPGYLRETLQSIRQQTFQDFEVIVSDNDIEESGREAVESFNDPRFRYYSNNGNLGMKKSFNKSLERSTGRYIVMIADDDPVYPHMLQALHKLQDQHPGSGMYLGGCDWFCTSSKVGKLYNFKVGTNTCLSNEHDVGYVQSFTPPEFLTQLFSFGIFPHYLWSTAIVKREILLQIGGVPEYGTPFLGDYAYMGAIGAQAGCVVLNLSLGCQTLHEENFGRKQNEQLVVAAREFPKFLESKAAQLSEWPQLKELVLRFTALWIVSHMSFLYQYYKKLKMPMTDLLQAEKEVFRLEHTRRFRFKYMLKSRYPRLHNFLVRVKKALK